MLQHLIQVSLYKLPMQYICNINAIYKTAKQCVYMYDVARVPLCRVNFSLNSLTEKPKLSSLKLSLN